MASFRLVLFTLVLVPSLGLAQPPRPAESVTVTGTRSREVIQDFVQSFTAPTRLTGKMARWGSGICPVTVGLPPQFVKFINQRLKDIATQAGAPVNERTSCMPNIAIIFTTTPQTLLDNVRKKRPNMLGYYDSSVQLKELATVTHPIQAWYMTATRDLRGNFEVDSPRTSGTGLEITYECIPPAIGICTLHLSNAHSVNVTGERLGDGMRSELYNVIIVADPNKLASYEMGSLADYMAMLALTQIISLDTCQQLPSIVNMLAKDCETKSSALTENDVAYLRGLYKIAPGGNLAAQKDQVSYQMEQELKGK